MESSEIMSKLRTNFSPASFSFAAIFIIIISQMFNYNLLRQATQKIYINQHESYLASIELVEIRPGRSVSRLYRLIYEMRKDNRTVHCDTVINYGKTILPILDQKIRVTPKNNSCEDPYLTDYEYFPLYNSLVSASLLALASVLLCISSYKMKIVSRCKKRQSQIQ